MIFNKFIPTTMNPAGPLLTRPLAFLYGLGAGARRLVYTRKLCKPRKLSCPVISIGNITTGGTGKTPMTIFLTRMLKDWGLSPIVLSRGYRGSLSSSGGLVSDGRQCLMTADQAGDEPFMMAQALPGVPIVIGRDRYRAAALALKHFHADLIILDDGFQHFQLDRDMDIVLMDHACPAGNGHMLPAGRLREPLFCLKQADVIIFTRAERESAGLPRYFDTLIETRPVFYTRHVPLLSQWIKGDQTKAEEKDKRFEIPPEGLDGRKVFAFCALADNNSFLNSLEHLGARIRGKFFFRDHHFYTAGDMTKITDQAKAKGAELLATSTKDLVKITSRNLLPLTFDLAVVDAVISFEKEKEAFESFIKNQMNRLGITRIFHESI